MVMNAASGPYDVVQGDLSSYQLDRDSIRLLAEAYCRRNEVVVLGRVDPGYNHPVTLGMLYPDRGEIVADVTEQLHRQVVAVRLNRYEIDRVIKHGFVEEQEEAEYQLSVDLEPATADSPPRVLLDHLLVQAVARGVSDVHIETYQKNVDVRVRRDGILHEVFSHIHPENVKEVINRLKVIARLNLSERRRPQDGRFRVIMVDGEVRYPIDFRVSVIPSPAGEDAVLRVLDARVGLVPLQELGMRAQAQAVFMQLLKNPEGMILVTGPTGCGKTSTLYSALEQVSDGTRKVVTAEDPIEYYLPKVNQKEVSPLITMPELLRSLLRHDPDVMLFGEIRDAEAAQIAARAANTGHLVLGTLHSSDAIGAIERLRGLGLSDFDLASVMLCVVSQRLVRRVCSSCAQPTIPTEEQSAILGDLLDGLQFLEGGGCEECGGSGYNGRTAIFEMLLVSEAMQDVIAASAHRSQIRALANESGFTTLVEHGLAKVAAGETTVSELMRVIPYRQLITEAQQAYLDNFEP